MEETNRETLVIKIEPRAAENDSLFEENDVKDGFISGDVQHLMEKDAKDNDIGFQIDPNDFTYQGSLEQVNVHTCVKDELKSDSNETVVPIAVVPSLCKPESPEVFSEVKVDLLESDTLTKDTQNSCEMKFPVTDDGTVASGSSTLYLRNNRKHSNRVSQKTPVKEIFRCSYCPHTFNNLKMMVLHRALHDENSFYKLSRML